MVYVVNLSQLHWACMLVSWGFLLPAGAIIARFMKHRPNGTWYKIHRIVQPLGLVIALIGWIVAICHYGPSVFSDYGQNNFRHACCGTTVMILGLLQPLNAFVRPHHDASSSEDKSKTRCMWEILHKGSGWLAIVLAIFTIGLGLSLLKPSHLPPFLYSYVAELSLLLLLIAFIFYDKHTYNNSTNNNKVEEVEEVGEVVQMDATDEEAISNA